MRPRILVPLVVLVALALPMLSAISLAKSKHGHGQIPSCSAISRKAMAKLAQTGHLKLRKKTGNFCSFTGKGAHHGHYKTMFAVQIIPYITSVWNTAESDAKSAAAKNGSTFGQTNKQLFFVSGAYTSAGLGPCTKGRSIPGKGLAKFAPACAGEPSAAHFSVYGNGIDTSRPPHLHLMVSVAVTGQAGDVHLSHVLTLVKDIISGKIH